jgi:hypothetical protein
MDIQNRQGEVEEMGRKLLTGLKMAHRKLVETAAANNESLIIADENGKPISVPAKELLAKMQK